MALRPEFTEAITLLATAMTRAVKEGCAQTVLVGGAAVEFYTGGAVTSGDFDLVTPDQERLARLLEAVGFQRIASNSYQMLHPTLGIGVDFVSGQLMDGKAETARILVVEIGPDKRLAVIPAEDLIADRMAQALAVDPPRKDMINQAVIILKLAEPIDKTYLNKRIVEETLGTANLSYLETYFDA